MTEKMNILEFAKSHQIKFFGNQVKIYNEDGVIKKDPPITYHSCYSGLPDKQYDYTQLHSLTFDKCLDIYENGGHLGNCYCIDTQEVCQIDVDFSPGSKPHPDLINFIEEIKLKTPYTISATKDCPHLLFHPADDLAELIRSKNLHKCLKIFKTPGADIEIMSGQGIWVPKDKAFKDIPGFNKRHVDTVFNADKQIITLGKKDLEKYFDFSAKKSIIKKNKKISKGKAIINIPSKPEDYTEDQKYFQELGNLIPIDVLDDFEDWKRIILSLASFDDTGLLLPIAHEISARSDKYEAEKVNELFQNKYEGITIGTFKYYCRGDKENTETLGYSNQQEFNNIEVKYFKRRGLVFRTHTELAEYFLKKERQDIIYHTKDSIYHYNNKTGIWEEDHPQTLGRLHGKIAKVIVNYADNLLPLVEKDWREAMKKHEELKKQEDVDETELDNAKYFANFMDEEYKELKSIRKHILNVSLSNNVITMVKRILSIEQQEIDFDINPYYFTFAKSLNGEQLTLDLKTGHFVVPKKEEYQSMSCGYEYRESTESERDWVKKNLFNKIFLDEELREYYIKCLATGLIGATPQKFIIANGRGGNGKGVLHGLMRATCGLYAFKGNADIFLNEKARGANPELANLHKIRFATFDEPATGKKINVAFMKEITGGTEICARQLYSNNTKCVIHSTMVLETNEMLQLGGSKLGDAEMRRILDIHFASRFTDDKAILQQNLANVFPKCNVFATDTWHNDYKFALLDILIDVISNTDDIFASLTPPKQVKDRTADYIEGSKELLNEIKELVEFLDRDPKTKKKNYITIKDLTEKLRASHWYSNLTKAQKKTINSNYIKQYIGGELSLELYFDDSKIKVNNTTIRSALYWCKWKDTEDEQFEI